MKHTIIHCATKNEYAKKNYRQLLIRFNKEKDAALINWIESQSNATEYITSLMRKDMIESKFEAKKQERIEEGLKGAELKKVLAEDRKQLEEEYKMPEPSKRGRKLQSVTDQVKLAEERQARKDEAVNDFSNIMSYISSLPLEEQEKILKRTLKKEDD